MKLEKIMVALLDLRRVFEEQNLSGDMRLVIPNDDLAVLAQPWMVDLSNRLSPIQLCGVGLESKESYVWRKSPCAHEKLRQRPPEDLPPQETLYVCEQCGATIEVDLTGCPTWD